jgi:hypothetical protein
VLKAGSAAGGGVSTSLRKKGCENAGKLGSPADPVFLAVSHLCRGSAPSIYLIVGIAIGDVRMPIHRFLGEDDFDQEAIDSMTAAFNDALQELGLIDVDDPLVEIVANTIIECARRGDLDSASMRDCAIKEIKR